MFLCIIASESASFSQVDQKLALSEASFDKNYCFCIRELSQREKLIRYFSIYYFNFLRSSVKRLADVSN